MQYDIYYEKVNKFAGFMKKVFKLMWLIILVLAVITAAVVAFLIVKGNILSDGEVNDNYVYGDDIELSAKALFSKVSAEYFVDGEWTDSAPARVGSYKVRGVSRAAFGKEKYTEEHSFNIVRRDVTVSVDATKMTYGDNDFAIGVNNLLDGDKLVCEGFNVEYIVGAESDATDPRSRVEPKADKIRITNAAGVDVTDCYNVKTDCNELKVNKRPLNVTVSDKSIVYNNTVLAFDGYETDGNEANGDVVEAVFSASIINVGEVKNVPELRVVNKNGDDVSRFYDLRCTTGKLKIEKRPIIIKTNGGSKVYDGKQLANTSCEILGEYSVCEGQTLNLTFPTLINAGKRENLPRYSVIDNVSGDDKTYNYSFFFDVGTLEIEKRPIYIETGNHKKMYDGTNVMCDEYDITGEYGICDSHNLTTVFLRYKNAGIFDNNVIVEVCDADGKYVTDNYKFIITCGQVEITRRPIEIQVGSAEKVYDGEALSCTEYDVIGEYDFCEGHVLMTSFPSLTLAGTVKNEMTIVAIRDENGGEVKHNYQIHYTQGTLTVKKRDLTITAPDGEWMYDSYAHSTEILFSTYTGFDTVYYKKSTSIIFAGSVKNDVEVILKHYYLGDVTKCYNVTYDCGTLTVTKRPITIYTPSVEKVYDGQVLAGYWVDAFGGEGLADNDSFHIIAASGITNVGSIKNEFYEYYFSGVVPGWDDEPQPESVYDIAIEDGDWVMPVEEPTTEEPIDKIDGPDIDPVPPIDDVIDPDWYILNSYDITWVYGTLTVTPREVYIRPADSQKAYDGTPLYATGFSYCDCSPNDFVSGHRVSMSYSGSITEIGTVSSKIDDGSIYVTDSLGNDVLGNYNIIATERGSLTVYPRPITITTNNAEKDYDGYPLEHHDYRISSGSLLNGHYLSLTINGSQTEIGKSPNSVAEGSVMITVNVSGGETTDVTKYYDIKIEEGELRVNDPYREMLEITPATLSKDYDGDYLYAANILEERGLLADLLARGYHYSVEISGSQREVGYGVSRIQSFTLYDYNWNDVTDQYSVIYNDGILEVREGTIRVFLYEIQKYYDGTPLSFLHDDYSIISIPDDCALSLTLNISLTDVGEIKLDEINDNINNFTSYRVYKNGVDVTDKYALKFDVYPDTHADYVPIRVDPRSIEVTAASAEKYYDGNALTNNNYAITKGTLADGHQLFAVVQGGIIEPGSAINSISEYYIVDTLTGVEVTHNYTVKTYDGTLTVHEKNK